MVMVILRVYFVYISINFIQMQGFDKILILNLKFGLFFLFILVYSFKNWCNVLMYNCNLLSI